MKRTLFLYYSQAGQAAEAIEALARPFGPECDVVRFETSESFAFPWSVTDFFRAFPRCVRGDAPAPRGLNIAWDRYDLVVLGYQVWFLSPSLPFQGFLQSAEARGLRGKRVITLLTCRNLWYSASRVAREKLLKLEADFLGQITVCEKSPLWASFVTTPRWMLTGRKNAFAFFPPAGIQAEDFQVLADVGTKLARSWKDSNGREVDRRLLTSNLDRLSLRLMDRIGRRFFRIWASVIAALAPQPGLWQDFVLILFRLNLIALIVSVGPCTKIIELLVGNGSKLSQRQV